MTAASAKIALRNIVDYVLRQFYRSNDESLLWTVERYNINTNFSADEDNPSMFGRTYLEWQLRQSLICTILSSISCLDPRSLPIENLENPTQHARVNSTLMNVQSICESTAELGVL